MHNDISTSDDYYKLMTTNEIKKVLYDHARWLRGEEKGKRADLRDADFSGADLSGADLMDADLSGADLRDADFSGADLSGADLRDADLSGADLRRADLSGADLSGADLSGAVLRDADLRRADLRDAVLSGADLSGADLSGAVLRDAVLSGADLSGADLSGADLMDADLSGADLSGAVLPNTAVCPSNGAFNAWKKCQNNVIVKLYVTETAKRVNALSSRKIRVSKAKPIWMSDGKTVAYSKYDGTKYEINKYVTPDAFDDDIRKDCASGIHCFITRKEAEEYY